LAAGGPLTIANYLQTQNACGSAAQVTLDQLPLGKRARIAAVDWTALVPEEAQRLRALGLDEGAEVRLAYRGVFLTRDPLAIEIGRMTVALRRVHARAMQVEAA
jgi:ferrous iron transport protein A